MWNVTGLRGTSALRYAIGALLAVGTASVVEAQGTINDGPATFVLDPDHFDTTPGASLTGVSPTLPQDHVFEEGWWYRVQGDTAEAFFPVPDVQGYAGSTATLTWNDVDGHGFSALEIITVAAEPGPSGYVEAYLTVTNNGTADLPITVFHAVDIDLAGTSSGDAGILLSPNDYIGITDGPQTGEYRGPADRGPGPSAFLVRPFGDPQDVMSELSDSDIDDFDSSGLPFAAGDLTLGFQWAMITIPPGGQQVYHVVMAINVAAGPVELQGFTVE